MGAGYTRQSAAEIQTGEVVEAAPLNAEFNQLQNAFDGTTGHSHDGTVGEGPKINLPNSVAGVLQIVNGGTGGIHKLDATVAPAVTDDTNDGYTVGSVWINTTADTIYICVDATAGAAVWLTYQALDAALTSIASLTTSANQMIYTTAADTYATTTLTAYARTLVDDADASTALSTLGVSTFIKTLLDDADASTALSTLGVSTYIKTLLDDADAATARSTLGLGSISTQASSSVSITGGTITGITDLAVADGGTGASTAANARTNLGLVIGTDVQAQDAELQAIAGLTSAADRLPYFTGSGTASLATFTAAGRALVDDADAAAQRTTLGLGNVDNTSDANKPISTAMQTLLDDPFNFTPIGVPIPVMTHKGASAPSTSAAYRFIKLSAADAYNSSVVTSESVTGSTPLVVATGVISLAGSPLDGQTVNLWNSEGRIPRAGSTGGTLQNDAFQGHYHSLGTSVFTGGSGGIGTGSGNINPLTVTAPITDGTNGTPRTANETRMKNESVIYYMRIK